MADRSLLPTLLITWVLLAVVLQWQHRRGQAEAEPPAEGDEAIADAGELQAEPVPHEPRGDRRSGKWPDDFDPLFRKYSKHYFGPGFDWRWFKAQAIAESGLDHNARSYVGAIGVMQIMPRTYEEIRGKNPHFGDITSRRWNVAAGIYYNRYLYDRWRRLPHPDTRRDVMFASYNAGYSRVNRALQRAGSKQPPWSLVEPHVPSQTRHYVRRIKKIRNDDLAR